MIITDDVGAQRYSRHTDMRLETIHEKLPQSVGVQGLPVLELSDTSRRAQGRSLLRPQRPGPRQGHYQ